MKLFTAIIFAAAVVAAPELITSQAQQPVSFCVEDSEGTSLKCDFITIAVCQEALKAESRTDRCIPTQR